MASSCFAGYFPGLFLLILFRRGTRDRQHEISTVLWCGPEAPASAKIRWRLGQPVVPNGIPLSKIHHAAFDSHLIGIDPDYRLHVSNRLLGAE
jgi:hypothetical protein